MCGNSVLLLHGQLQGLAGGDVVAHAQDRVGVDDVAGGPGHRFQGLHQRHAGGEHGGQGAGEAGDGRPCAGWSPMTGILSSSAVQQLAEFARALRKIARRA